MKRIAAIVLAGNFAIASAQPAYSEKDLLDTVERLAKCSGVYDAGSLVSGLMKTDQTRERAHQLANGYAIAAEYLLAQNDLIKGNRPRPLGDFAAQVNAIAEREKARSLSLIQDDKFSELFSALDSCEALAPIEQQLSEKAAEAPKPR